MEFFQIFVHVGLSFLLIGHIIDGWIAENRKKKEEATTVYRGHRACKNCGESMSFDTQAYPKFCPFCGERYEEEKE
jgi:uncharacterized paraquat-inducible protein A